MGEEMNLSAMSKLHSGHVLVRHEDKVREVVAKTQGSRCISCKRTFDTEEKVVRFERGTTYLFYECFKCYISSGEDGE